MRIKIASYDLHCVCKAQFSKRIECKQSKFEGSFRQKRAQILRCLLAQPGQSAGELAGSSGFELADVERALDALLHIANSELANVQVNGLMTMAPFASAEDVRWIFEDLRKLRDGTSCDGPSVALNELSMGMTGDFEAAIEEGATLVRVGTALFA